MVGPTLGFNWPRKLQAVVVHVHAAPTPSPAYSGLNKEMLQHVLPLSCPSPRGSCYIKIRAR
eukprot:scaffold4147_cov114-Isochrysis_galbana.AAC.3